MDGREQEGLAGAHVHEERERRTLFDHSREQRAALERVEACSGGLRRRPRARVRRPGRRRHTPERLVELLLDQVHEETLQVRWARWRLHKLLRVVRDLRMR